MAQDGPGLEMDADLRRMWTGDGCGLEMDVDWRWMRT